nr:immunoglobulin heavy chain junction region [Macaca mulatta]MOY19218.1 immunoglobulin heavy chain junction region [Macaca mulatta]
CAGSCKGIYCYVSDSW